MKRQRQLTKAVIVLAIVCTILGFWLVKVYSAERAYTDEPNYSITIYEDGRTQIDVRNIGLVQQKADGTLIIEGDGEAIE